VNAFAGLEKVTLQNLDLDYALPFGKGTVERVGIGMSLAADPYAIEVHRLTDSFEITSPYLDFSWSGPNKLLHDLEKLQTKKASASLGSTKQHFIESEFLLFRPKARGDYQAHHIKGSCEGESSGKFQLRLMQDCRNKMDLTIEKIDFPTDFIIYKIIEDLPPVVTEEDVPGDHVILSSREGNYALQVYVKYWIRAGLRSWGHVQFENDNKTVAIRVDKVKFGYLTVTGLVMRKLKELITNPDITVDPPWIRINLEGTDETKSH
jgi:hypothetical protein